MNVESNPVHVHLGTAQKKKNCAHLCESGIEPCLCSWYLCSSPELKFVFGNCQIEASPLQKKMFSLVSTWNWTLLMFLIPLFVPWTQVCLWELSDRSPFRLLNWFFSLIESVDNTAMVFLVCFFFSVVCWLHFSAWSCWIKPTVKHKNKPIKLQETEIEKKIPNKLKENKIRIAF